MRSLDAKHHRRLNDVCHAARSRGHPALAGRSTTEDAVDAAAAVVRLYKIAHVRDGAKMPADLRLRLGDRITEALAALERRDGVSRLAARVKLLEHEADRVHQDAIVELFDQERDPIAVIKWKEIFDFLEAATDRCEDVANLLEGVVVKHA